ncbi:MAG TPA: DUF1801 domain-containing protein [Dehalococcoidia bacterium]|nr:DUF1801 domain-containing protein [Dehalococcoidia bacterium]
MTQRTSNATDTSGREIVITRVYDAPRELVFKAWVEPEHLVRWYHASDDWTTPYAETDPRPGGAFRIGFASPDGKAAAPEAVEMIAYRMPAYKYRGRSLVYIGAAKNHCALYGMSDVIAAHKDELAAYDTSKGTVRFPDGKPLPDALVKKLVKARIGEIEAARTTP